MAIGSQHDGAVQVKGKLTVETALLPGIVFPLAVLILSALFIAPRFVTNGPFKYDEADYAYAAKQGIWNNYVDARALTTPQLLSLGIEELRGEAAVGLSQLIRNSNDASFYRHWHGPVYYYYLFVSGLLTGWSEYGTRCATLALYLLAGIAGVWTAFRLAPSGSAGIAQFALRRSVRTKHRQHPNSLRARRPHALFSLFSILSLTYIGRFLTGNVLRDWYIGLIFAGAACATLEVGLILPIAASISYFLVRRRSPVAWSRPEALAFGLRSLLVVILSVLLLWPAGLLKIGLLKPYGFQLFLALFRESQWGTDISLADSWIVRLESFPVDWLLFAAGVGIFLRRRAALRALLPFAVYIPLMMLLLLPVATTVPRYMSPYFPVLQIFTAVAVGSALAQIKPAVLRLGAVSVLCLTAVAAASRHWPATADQQSAESDWRPIELLREAKLEKGARLLAPQLLVPSLHYYFPDVRLSGYTSDSELQEAESQAQADLVLHVEPSLSLVRIGNRPGAVDSPQER